MLFTFLQMNNLDFTSLMDLNWYAYLLVSKNEQFNNLFSGCYVELNIHRIHFLTLGLSHENGCTLTLKKTIFFYHFLFHRLFVPMLCKYLTSCTWVDTLWRPLLHLPFVNQNCSLGVSLSYSHLFQPWSAVQNKKAKLSFLLCGQT